MLIDHLLNRMRIAIETFLYSKKRCFHDKMTLDHKGHFFELREKVGSTHNHRTQNGIVSGRYENGASSRHQHIQTLPFR